MTAISIRELVLRLVGATSANLHRIYRCKALAQAQSEALLDTLRIFERAERAFAGFAVAREWLETALPAFGGQRPIDLCDTFEGRRRVQDAIRRIERGEFP
ncbi:MAG: MbcA/ParS/Xre antitoxin family protein [Acidobacteriota bacterium]|nr:MbcA/ParS/Xre antitoxin family protein [Acidobacteriota bacterium]